MKNKFHQLLQYFSLIIATLVSLSSCKKDISATSVNQTSISITNAVPVTKPLGVALNGYANSSVDSVFVVYTGDNTLLRDEIPASVLPANVQVYQTDNYENNTQLSVYKLIDINGKLKSYLSIITFNQRPVALEFDIDGNLVKVLEQREKADLNNDGWHSGGLFEDRGGSTNNTIDINSLPDEIKNYMANTYPDETISKALKTKENATIVLTNNVGSIATIFNAGLAFHKHIEMSSSTYQMDEVAKASIQSEVLIKVANTFPNYAFEAAYHMSENGAYMGNLFLINANNTHYAVTMDDNGSILSHKVIF